jgi:farnesyl-diphosphate farnesyltransferase
MNHHEMLRAVSRTFALSIEKLPPVLREAITVAYLLFRISDCIEDHAAISAERKATLLRLWGTILSGDNPASLLTSELADLDSTDPEVYVARHADRVMEYLNNQPPQLKEIIAKHANDTADGMARWQEQGPLIKTEEELDDYMHQVAGRVGYLVTDIFSWYSPLVRAKRERLIPLGRDFGLGLQTVNIIRGLRKDYDRGWVFVPLTFLEKKGLSPDDFFDAATRQQALAVIDLLIAKAQRHLENGLAYITLLPRREHHIRLSCIWPLLFAVKTLALSRNNHTVLESETKMTRNQVKNIVLISSTLFWSNSGLRYYYHFLGR